jgi:hypothetical protein
VRGLVHIGYRLAPGGEFVGNAMISEIPTPADFAQASTAALNLAWDIAVDLTETFRVAIEDLDFDEEEIGDGYWEKAQRQLGNAIALLQQGLELALKAKIAEVSPFLLITNTANDLPGNAVAGIPFSDFRTVDAKDLIKVHDVFAATPIPASFSGIFEKNRRLRNQFIHGIVRGQRISERQVYAEILAGFKLLNIAGKTWPQVRVEYLSSETSSSVVDTEGLGWGRALAEFDSVVALLPRRLLIDCLGFDKRARRYICPGLCFHEMGSDFRDYVRPEPIALAQLLPNSPDSSTVHCFACGSSSTVVRRSCSACGKSNVLGRPFEEDSETLVCLVCGDEQPADSDGV